MLNSYSMIAEAIVLALPSVFITSTPPHSLQLLRFYLKILLHQSLQSLIFQYASLSKKVSSFLLC